MTQDKRLILHRDEQQSFYIDCIVRYAADGGVCAALGSISKIDSGTRNPVSVDDYFNSVSEEVEGWEIDPERSSYGID